MHGLSMYRVMSLERAVSSQLYSRRHEFRKVFCSLEDADIKLSQGRKTESTYAWFVSVYMYGLWAMYVHGYRSMLSMNWCVKFVQQLYLWKTRSLTRTPPQTWWTWRVQCTLCRACLSISVVTCTTFIPESPLLCV